LRRSDRATSPRTPKLVSPYLIANFEEDTTIWLEFAAVASRDREVKETMTRLYHRWRAPILRAIEDGVE
jgi:hypothetical protein